MKILILLFPLLLSAEFLQKGNILYERGELDSAVLFYNRALRENENRALCYINLGNCYYRKADLPQAAAFYRLSIEYAPDFFRPYYNLTTVYSLLEGTPSAIITAHQALLLEPDNGQLILLLASLYREMNDFSSAIILLEQNLNIEDNLFHLTALLFDLYREAGNSSRAVEILMESDDSFPDKYLLLGHTYTEMNNYNQAEIAFREAIKESRDAHYYLVQTMINRGNHFSALVQAELTLKEYPALSNVALLAAETAIEQKWYFKAEQFYFHAYRHKDPHGLVGLQNLLNIYENQGFTERFNKLRVRIASLR